MIVWAAHIRSTLPSGISAAAEEVGGPPEVLPPGTWVQPFASDRSDLRLALIVGMQALSATQRAVLLLRDVLAFTAAEVAAMLDTSVVAVKSSLQRARARMAEAAPSPGDVVEPTAPEARRLLDAYVIAFENRRRRGPDSGAPCRRDLGAAARPRVVRRQGRLLARPRRRRGQPRRLAHGPDGRERPTRGRGVPARATVR